MSETELLTNIWTTLRWIEGGIFFIIGHLLTRWFIERRER